MNTLSFLDSFNILFLCVTIYMSAAWRVEMLAGVLFKQNYNRSWITAATQAAGVETWKSATSPASHFRRSL